MPSSSKRSKSRRSREGGSSRAEVAAVPPKPALAPIVENGGMGLFGLVSRMMNETSDKPPVAATRSKRSKTVDESSSSSSSSSEEQDESSDAYSSDDSEQLVDFASTSSESEASESEEDVSSSSEEEEPPKRRGTKKNKSKTTLAYSSSKSKGVAQKADKIAKSKKVKSSSASSGKRLDDVDSEMDEIKSEASARRTSSTSKDAGGEGLKEVLERLQKAESKISKVGKQQDQLAEKVANAVRSNGISLGQALKAVQDDVAAKIDDMHRRIAELQLFQADLAARLKQNDSFVPNMQHSSSVAELDVPPGLVTTTVPRRQNSFGAVGDHLGAKPK